MTSRPDGTRVDARRQAGRWVLGGEPCAAVRPVPPGLVTVFDAYGLRFEGSIRWRAQPAPMATDVIEAPMPGLVKRSMRAGLAESGGRRPAGGARGDEDGACPAAARDGVVAEVLVAEGTQAGRWPPGAALADRLQATIRKGDAMITLHHCPQSRSMRVLWLLNELEVDFRCRSIPSTSRCARRNT